MDAGAVQGRSRWRGALGGGPSGREDDDADRPRVLPNSTAGQPSLVARTPSEPSAKSGRDAACSPARARSSTDAPPGTAGSPSRGGLVAPEAGALVPSSSPPRPPAAVAGEGSREALRSPVPSRAGLDPRASMASAEAPSAPSAGAEDRGGRRSPGSASTVARMERDGAEPGRIAPTSLIDIKDLLPGLWCDGTGDIYDIRYVAGYRNGGSWWAKQLRNNSTFKSHTLKWCADTHEVNWDNYVLDLPGLLSAPDRMVWLKGGGLTLTWNRSTKCECRRCRPPAT